MKIFSLIVTVQLITIIFIIVYIYETKDDVLGQTIINPVTKESISKNNGSLLRYYYEPKPNSIEKVNEWGPANSTYTINSESLNERFDYVTDKLDNTFRIITLGDSYTYGLYVDTPQNWSEQLEDLLNMQKICKSVQKYEVINLGVHGYDIQYAVERFRLRGQKYTPDVVLFLIKTDDVIQVNEILFEKLNLYKTDEGYGAWNRAMQETYDELGEDGSIQYQLNSLKNLFDMYTGTGAIITFPNFKHFPKDLISDIDRGKRFDFVNLTDIYKNKTLFYKDDYHPTAAGHKVISEDIYTYLTENNIIPCN